MKRNAGFTLIELVIVIIVLGILAATAVPKFINLQDDAKESALKGVEAALHSAANIVFSKAAIDGKEKNTTATDVAGISTIYGFPVAAAGGIDDAVELSGFNTTVSGTTAIFYATGAASTGACTVVYTQASSTAAGSGYQIWFGTATSATSPTCG